VLAQLLCGVDAMPAEIRRIYARARALIGVLGFGAWPPEAVRTVFQA